MWVLVTYTAGEIPGLYHDVVEGPPGFERELDMFGVYSRAGFYDRDLLDCEYIAPEINAGLALPKIPVGTVTAHFPTDTIPSLSSFLSRCPDSLSMDRRLTRVFPESRVALSKKGSAARSTSVSPYAAYPTDPPSTRPLL